MNYQNKNSQPFEIAYGKLSPQAIDVEEAILGAFIIEANAILENNISPEWFYKDENQIICQAVIDLNSSGKKIDLLTVTRKLKDSGKLDEVGGPTYITNLIKRVASASNIEQYIHILHDKFTRREAIRTAYEIQNMAYDETKDVEDLISFIHNNTLGLLDFKTDAIKTFDQACDLLMQRVINNTKSNKLSGIDTGFMKLNKFTGGWQGSDLVIVAGETSQGKTSLVMNFAMMAAVTKIPGVIYSLEMSLLQLTARLISSKINVSSKHLLFEPLNESELCQVNDGISRFKNIPIYTDDNVNNTIESICTSIRRMVYKFKIRYAIVDYIQNVREITGKNEEGSLGIIVKMLKNLAKELNITIFAVSQLSRNKEKPIPTISRLRGSGQIEETADIILMVYRPEYYNISTFPEPFENESVNDRALITIGKGRNIGTGSFIVNFDKRTTTFSDIVDEIKF